LCTVSEKDKNKIIFKLQQSLTGVILLILVCFGDVCTLCKVKNDTPVPNSKEDMLKKAH
jgi:hypothetical protein